MHTDPPDREYIRDFAPRLVEFTDGVLDIDVWGNSALTRRDRSLITVAALIALNRTGQLSGHLRKAIDNDVTQDELVEVITHLAFYSGWPTAFSAAAIAKDFFEAT